MSAAMEEAAIHELLGALKRSLIDFEVGEADASPTVRHRIEGAVIALEGVLGTNTDPDLFETLTTEWSSTSRTWG